MKPLRAIQVAPFVMLAITLSAAPPASAARSHGTSPPTRSWAPAAPMTVTGPSLWHVADVSTSPLERPPILSGSRDLWCGAYDPCWTDSLGYPNIATEVLYIDTGAHSQDYSISFTLSSSSEFLYDYLYLIGGGGDAVDPIGNDRATIDNAIGGSVGSAQLLVSWDGTILTTTPGAGSINTTVSAPVTIHGSNGGAPEPVNTIITINQHHRALYLVFKSDCIYSPSDGFWPFGAGVILDNISVSDHGTLYVDQSTAGGTDAFGGTVLVGTPGAPVLSSRKPTFTNRDPILTAPASQTLSEGSAVSLSASASDPDLANVLTLSAAGYPAGLAFSSSNGNPATASITGTLGVGTASQGPYRIRWCVADGSVGQAGATTVLTVTGVNSLPAIAAPSNLTTNEGTSVSLVASATDPDASNNLAVSVIGAPADLAFTSAPGPSPRTGTLSGTPGCDDGNGHPTMYHILWTVTDGAGGMASASTFLSVNDVPQTPQLSAPPDVTHPVQSFIEVDVLAASCGPISSLTADLTALPAGNNAVFSVGGTSGGPNTRGVLTWTPGPTDGGDYDVFFTGSIPLITATVRTTIHVTRVPTAVASGSAPSFSLDQNQPNPFNPITAIRYSLPGEGAVLLTIYDLHGRKLTTLQDGNASAGVHEVRWDGRDSRGKLLPSGTYVYRIQSGTYVSSRRMVLLR